MNTASRISKLSKKLYLAIGLFIIIAFVGLFMLFYSINQGWFGFMPSLEELKNPKELVASQLYSEDEKLLGTYYKENRIAVPYDEISPLVIQSLIVVEDERFFEHAGIDFLSLPRVIWGILSGSAKAGGGSTISQQLAKMMFPRDNLSLMGLVMRKFKEWVIAVKLERQFTKEEILTMYLNKFDFFYLAVGIKQAALTYFGKDSKDLNAGEAATLIAMCKNPVLYNPVRNPNNSKGRRDLILAMLHRENYISDSTYAYQKEHPTPAKLNRILYSDGVAPYLRELVRSSLTARKPDAQNYPAWMREQFVYDSIQWETNPMYGWCNKNKKYDGTNYNLYEDGLRIHSTINRTAQIYAEHSVEEYLSETLQPLLDDELSKRINYPFSNELTPEEVKSKLWLQIRQSERYRQLKRANPKITEKEIWSNFNKKREMTVFTWKTQSKDTLVSFSPLDSIKYYLSLLHSSFMALNPNTGEVKAYVGGVNFRYFKYDMAVQGRRQVGSTLKPFLYALAIKNGFTPCQTVLNSPVTIGMPDGSGWTPKNEGHRELEGVMISLNHGLALSLNYMAAYLIKQLGVEPLIDMLRKAGVYSSMPPYPSVALGSSDISLYELIGAYSIFPNQGVHVRPYFVSRIEDKYGSTLATFEPSRKEVLDANTAYIGTQMLSYALNHGTGIRARYMYDVKGDAAGKTGTTNDNSDGWFVGFTPQLLGATWTGAQSRDVHFMSTAFGGGHSMALPIWAKFMKRVYEDPSLNYSDTLTFVNSENIELDLYCPQNPPLPKKNDGSNTSGSTYIGFE